MKKLLLLLLTIVLTLFTVVYATEADLITAPAPDATETVTDESAENIDGAEATDPHAGHDHDDLADEIVTEDGTTDLTADDSDTTLVEDSHEGHDHTTETSSNGGSTVVGAIIAIVIVVAVIGLVALLQKK